MAESPWQNLWKRRVPQAVGIYLGISWAVIEFVGFMVDRYVLSPHLVTLSLVVLASLLPSVAIVAYFHGAPGRQGWTRVEKIGIPTNLLAMGVLLAVLFSGRDLGAATTVVSVTDEEGVTVERVVPKSAFRKRLAFFPFATESGDTASDWLQYGIPLAVQVDLDQDLFIASVGLDGMAEDLRETGFPTGLGLPLTLMRELAERQNMPYFLTGSFATTDTGIDATVRLYETRRARLLGERRHSRPSVFALADEISVGLKQDLGIPTHHIEEVEDLPVAERLTSSEAAYRPMVEAVRALSVGRDFPAALSAIRSAVEADPTNAYAHNVNYAISLFSNDQAGAAQALEATMRHLYKLPERTQYAIKVQHYDYSQDAEKALAVLQMWVDVLPDDTQGRSMYATMLSLRNRRPEAIEQLEHILEIDPTQTEVLRELGTQARSMGDFDGATDYFERYVEAFPENPEAYVELGRLQRLQGRFDEAKATLERGLLAEPGNVVVLVNLSALERRFGNLGAEMEGLNGVLAEAETSQDTVSAWQGLANAHEYRGRIQQALEYRDRAITLAATYNPPLPMLRGRLELLGQYAALGQEDLAREKLASLEAELEGPFGQMAAFGNLNLALELEDPDSVDAAVVRLQGLIDAFGVQALQGQVTHARARALEMRGQYSEAIETFQQALALTPTELSVHRDIGRCQRELGNLDAALASLEQSLVDDPHDPLTHQELALVHEARGDRAAAVEHLDQALEVWADAHPRFRPAAQARAKLEELRGSS